jgi:hypothetical protein
MKAQIFLIFLFLRFSHFIFAAPGDTTRIRVHDAVDMVWYENYDRPVTFPNSNVTYSKILMHYTMACASTGCSDWDYTTKIELRKPLGVMDSTVASIDTISTSPLVVDTTWNVFEVKESFELARVITPYGGYMRTGSNGYNSNWKHVHTFDVTDYAPLLKGMNEIRAFYGGWSSGFSVTIDFEFIEGTPPRNVLEVRNLWQSGGDGWSYQNPAHFEQTHLHPLSVAIPAEMQNAKLRFIPSGHGFDNNTSCAEFCEKLYYLKVDGTQVDSKLMWDPNCGMNPIYPQGGTWLYDRANWCPGTRTHAFDCELSSTLTAGTTHSFDIDIEPIVWSGTQAPVYILETQLFIYGEKNHQVDAAIEDIISPSNKDDHKRFNPICNQAKVKIKNYGVQNLTSATITYSVNGNNWRIYNWTGSLAFDETEIVELPMNEAGDWVGSQSPSEFIVLIENPNNQQDENNHNNRLTSRFQSTPVMPNAMEFQFRTNTRPAQTTWELYDGEGNVLKQNVANMTANTLYQDTFNLQPGCYLLKLKDTEKNGLSFWANNEGSGSARLRILGGSFIQTFKADFGTELLYYFTVGYTLDVNTLTEAPKLDVSVYPNPTEGEFTVLIDSPEDDDVKIELTNVMGQIIESDVLKLQSFGTKEKKYDLKGKSKGTYIIHITSKSSKITRKIKLL